MDVTPSGIELSVKSPNISGLGIHGHAAVLPEKTLAVKSQGDQHKHNQARELV